MSHRLLIFARKCPPVDWKIPGTVCGKFRYLLACRDGQQNPNPETMTQILAKKRKQRKSVKCAALSLPFPHIKRGEIFDGEHVSAEIPFVRMEHDEVSDFFNSLVIVARELECKKIDRDTNEIVDLTEEEYARIAYPLSTWIYLKGFVCHTYHSPNGKSFTVRQLADAFADVYRQTNPSREYIHFYGMRSMPQDHTFISQLELRQRKK